MEITRKMIACVCVVSAAVVAASGREGWGWFLFVAVLLL